MATNAFSQLITGLQSPTYSGLDLNAYANKNNVKKPLTGGMSKPTPEQLASFSNSNGATSPTPTKITAPSSNAGSYKGVNITPGNDASIASQISAIDRQSNPVLNTPIANQYISNQLSSSNLGSSTGGSTRTLKTREETRPSSNVPNSYTTAMKDYLSSLKNTQDITSRIQEQTLSGNRSYQELLDASGGLLTGNRESATLDARRTNATLADLGIASNAATNASNLALARLQLEKDLLPSSDPYTLSSGQARFDAQGNVIASLPETGGDGFTLSEGQIRYAIDPETGQYVPVGTNAGAQTTVSDPQINAWAQLVSSDPARLAQVPESIRNSVVLALQGLPPSASPEVQKAVQDASLVLGVNGQGGLISDALQLVSPVTTGIGALGSFVPGTPGYDLNSLIDTIRAKLGFQELQAMRAASPTGGALGQVTERELNFLQSAVANLDTKQSEKQLRKNLEKVRDHYQTWLDAVTQANQGGGVYSATGDDIWNF